MVEVDAGRPVWALGLMSGTSMDGIDAAMVQTDGEEISGFGPSRFLPYGRDDLLDVPPVMADPLAFRGVAERADAVARAEAEVARLHARAVVELLLAEGPEPAVIGFPGQTAAHAPEHRWTWQLGQGEALARALNRPVIWDFRSADIAAGGQGAPLAPFYHFALARWMGASEPVAFLNIGGVANATWVDPRADTPEADGALVAFDTGPGNALLNDWMQARTGMPVDRDGAMAARGLSALPRAGRVLETNFLRDYLERPGPKSLDRNAFGTMLERLEGSDTAEGAAALTALTADCAAAAAQHLPAPPARWLVCGGGRLNPVMMALLREGLTGEVIPVEAAGIDGDMLEAAAFAHLAVRSLRGLPLSAPGTTACPLPITGARTALPPGTSQPAKR